MAKCVIIDMERLYFRAVARVAHAAIRYRGTPPLAEFLRGRIDTAIDDLVREDAAADAEGLPLAREDQSRFRFLTQVLGVEPHLSRSAAVRFNVLDEEVRQTFFALVVEMRKFHRYVAEGNGPPERVRSHLRMAFEAIGVPFDEHRLKGGG